MERKQTNLHNVRHSRSQYLLIRMQPPLGDFVGKIAPLMPVFSSQVHFFWPGFFPCTHLALILLRRWSGRGKVTCVVWSVCCQATRQLGDSKILHCRGEVFDTQKAACVGEFQVGHFVHKSAKGRGSILVFLQNLRQDQVRWWWRSCPTCWDFAVHGQIMNKLINRGHRIIPEAVILGTLKHALLSGIVHMFMQIREFLC